MTNSTNIFPTEIRDSVETYDLEKILKMFLEDRDTIIDYFINRIEFSVNNGLINNELTRLFDNICQINNTYQLEKHENSRIIEKLDGHFEILITHSKVHNEICKYAFSLKNQGYDILHIHIINALLKKTDEKGAYWKSLFNSTLNTFQDKDTSEKLSELYTLEFKQVDNAIKLSIDQWNYLVSNTFVQDRIDDITDLTQDSDEALSVKTLFISKKNIISSIYENLFIKAISLIGEIRGKKKDEIIELLHFINIFLVLIPNGKLTNEPQKLYDLIISDRKMPHPNYPNSPQYDQKLNFITECLVEKNNISDLIDFAINIYRITNNNTSTTGLIEKIMKKDRERINEKILILIEQKISLKPILTLLFQDSNYSNKNSIALLKHCFNAKENDGEYSLSDTDVISKIDDLINYAYDSKSEEVYIFLESLLEHKRYKDILIKLIIDKDSEVINNLPPRFLEMAVDNFTEQNYEEYSNNYEFLLIIAVNGNKSQRKILVKILIPKIDNNEDINSVIKIVSFLSNIIEIDPDGLISTHLRKYMRENKDKISEELKKQLMSVLKKIKSEEIIDDGNDS